MDMDEEQVHIADIAMEIMDLPQEMIHISDAFFLHGY